MKSVNTEKPFPTTPEAWEAVIAAAPDTVDDPDGSYDPNDPDAVARFWANPIVSHSYAELREKLAERRRTRGPQKAPRKVSTTIRFDADVLAALKATGKGWQTRVNQVLREWIQAHPSR